MLQLELTPDLSGAAHAHDLWVEDVDQESGWAPVADARSSSVTAALCLVSSKFIPH